MSDKKLQDYIHFYIGCKCVITWFPDSHEQYSRDWQLVAFRLNTPKPYCLENEEDSIWTDSIKPILRHLEDITNEECEEYNRIRQTMFSLNKIQDQMKTDAALTNYLLKQGLDVFDLIHHSLAIDAKTIIQ